MASLSNMTTVLLVVVGAVVLCVGVAGGYMASLYAAEMFPIWMFVAFIGIILALVGIAMGMGGGKQESGSGH